MTKKLWIILTAVGCVLILVGGWFLLVSPQREKVASLNANTDSQQTVNQGLQSKLRRLQADAAQVPAQNAEIAKIKQQIPDDNQLPAAIRSLTQAASDAGVGLRVFTPAAPAAVPGATGVSFVALTMEAKGGYFALEKFLDNLEQLQRALLVNGVAINGEGSSGSELVDQPASSDSSSVAGATEASGCPNLSPDDPCLSMNLQARVFSRSANASTSTGTSSPAPSGTETPSSNSTDSPS